jgi:enamine deaminase RidA (YjgF/YER057c/UK114 family)
VGKVGKEVTVEEGYEAAKLVGLNLCATLKHNLGDLDKVKRVVKLTAFVNCVDGFAQQPTVVNGCSDLFIKIFGEKGRHTRSGRDAQASVLISFS